MTAMIEKTKQQLLDDFNAWYDEREREEKRGGKAITWEEIERITTELDIVDEFIEQEVHAAREEKRLEQLQAGETAAE